MNGFEFINEALSIKGNELDSIIAITDGLEVDWLEFKAAIKAKDSEKEADYNDADYILHFVKALVGMANDIGGLVILGIDDDGNAVGLEESGYRGDKDKFTRHVSSLFHKEVWRTKSRGRWSWKDTADKIIFNPHWVKYQGIDVLAFAVPPREKSLGPLSLIRTTHKNPEKEETIFIRDGGDIGKVTPRSLEDATKRWIQRDLARSSRKFKTWIRELQKTDPDLFQSVVSDYCNELLTDTNELKDIYVPLEADAHNHREHSTRRNRSKNDDYLTGNLKEKQPLVSRGDFEDIAKNVYPAFLIGEPGAGKTTSLLIIARELCFTNTTNPGAWALYVQLSDYTASGLQELICREIPPLNWSDIQLGLGSGALTLLLDGLNECPSNLYLQCEADLIDLFKEHPESKIFISTRPSHVPAFKQKTIELRAMASDRQSQFIKNYLHHDPDAEKSFWKALSQKWTAQMIARSPILLRMAVWVWVENNELPGGLAELYSTFFDAWLRREINKDLDAGTLEYWSEDDAREALSLLAYSMRCEGLVACSQSRAEKYLKTRLGDKSVPFISRLVQGLIIEKARNNSIRFKHETLQDFLVALFLTNHSEHQLIQTGARLDSRRWSMPIVFAFELFELPPEHFVETAWQLAPLLVCAAFRDENRLSLLREPIDRHLAPQNDLWVRGIVRCMRGESVADITSRLAHMGRTPSPGRYFQKHPLPEELTSALEGVAFWYSLSSHDEGRTRIERLQHLIIDRRNLWLELLPHVFVAQPNWLDDLTEAQKLLVGELDESKRDEALSNASIVELSFMVRNNIINENEFRHNWKRALNVDNTEPLELEILALLTTKKLQISQLNGQQRGMLKSIGLNKELSPRVLSVLAKNRIVKPSDIRSDQNRIKRLADRVSPIRAKQLVETDILRREDFSYKQLNALFDRVETEKDVRFILEAGLVDNRQQIPKSVKERAHGSKKHDKNKDAINVAPNVNINRVGSDENLDALISQVYSSEEQMLLKKISLEVKDSHNFPPGHGYHRVLLGHVEASKDWPLTEREALIELAEPFLREHGSKKHRTEYRCLIRTSREEIQNSKSEHKAD
ncbi:MAG: RNA-binding domain-containing protein [Candidatus Thiodiazotropha sp.]